MKKIPVFKGKCAMETHKMLQGLNHKHMQSVIIISTVKIIKFLKYNLVGGFGGRHFASDK